jgi:hypothetical protein
MLKTWMICGFLEKQNFRFEEKQKLRAGSSVNRQSRISQYISQYISQKHCFLETTMKRGSIKQCRDMKLLKKKE